MKKIIAVFLLFLSFISLASCSNTHIIATGPKVLREYSVASITSLSIDNVKIEQGSYLIPVTVSIVAGEKKVEIESEENILDSLIVDSSLGILSITTKSKTRLETEGIHIVISGYKMSNISIFLTNLTIDSSCLDNDPKLILSGASTLRTENLEGKSISVKLSGDSYFYANQMSYLQTSISLSESSLFDVKTLNSRNISFIASDSSKIYTSVASSSYLSYTLSSLSYVEVSGSSTKLDLILNGNSDYQGKNCTVEQATIIINDSSNCRITASKAINVIAGGGSMVEYYGDAIVTETNITGQSIVVRGKE